MTDIEKAKKLFKDIGISLPTIPPSLATQMKELGEWVFATRKIEFSSYMLDAYVSESNRTDINDYAIISHTGHGTNSYAIQYYLVHGCLRIFLHLGWGGLYMDTDAEIAKVNKCFFLADKIILGVMTADHFRSNECLTIVGSDFYGSYWSTQGQNSQKKILHAKDPITVLNEVLIWIK